MIWRETDEILCSTLYVCTYSTQAFISLRQYITLNTRMWKLYLADRHPFSFNFDPLNLTELPNPELEIIREERESEESEERDNGHTSIRRSITSPLISILSISKSPTPMSYECDFEPDFLTYFHKLILVKELRRESLDASIRSFISQTIGAEYIQTPVVDFNEVFSGVCTSTESNLVPILLIYSHDSTSYKDMIGDLEQLAESKLGSAAKLTHLVFMEQRVSQGFAVLKREAMRGGWVLCTNVHLQLTWLTNIVEHLMQMSRHGQKVHPNFRLWLTTKACNNFPISILHHSIKLRIESLKNLKVSMKETLLDRGAISHLDLEDQGAGPYWRRVLFTLCFFNTFIRCRNRYKKLGWNYVYDFGIRDFKCAKYIVHKLMTDHSSIPWQGIIESLSDTCYGGRIIDQKDSQRLECILAQFFNADVTTDNFKFFKNSINFPMINDDSSFEEWKSHIEQLPVNDSPESLGILRSADVMHSLSNANSLLQHLCEINHTAAGTGRSGLARDAVMQKSSVIFNSLPSKTVLPDLGNTWSTRGMDSISLSEMETGYDSNSPDSSLLLVLSREIEMYQKLLDLISSSIEELQYSRNSNVLMSSEMEGLYHDIKHDIVPRHWRCLCYPTSRKLASFILDLKQRCKFFLDWQDLLNSPRTPDGSGTSSPIPPKEMFSRPRSFWLGAFFYPNSFLTALKQHFCRQRKLPLESIQFQTRILIERRTNPIHDASLSQIDEAASGFTPGHEVHSGALVHGLYLEGCRWDTHLGGLTTLRGTSPISRLPPIHFIPLLKEKKLSRKLFYYKMPVYHSSERTIAHPPSCRGGFNEFNYVTHIRLPSLKSPDLWCLTNAAILLSPPSYATSP